MGRCHQADFNKSRTINKLSIKYRIMNISIFYWLWGCKRRLPTNNGHRVIGVDVMTSKVDLINQGKPTIIEKDIDRLIAENWKEGRAGYYRLPAYCSFHRRFHHLRRHLLPGIPFNLTTITKHSTRSEKYLREKDSLHIVLSGTVLPGTNEKVGRSGRSLRQEAQ